MIDPVLVPFDDRPGTAVLAWPVTATELRWWCGLTATPDRDQLARWHADHERRADRRQPRNRAALVVR